VPSFAARSRAPASKVSRPALDSVFAKDALAAANERFVRFHGLAGAA